MTTPTRFTSRITMCCGPPNVRFRCPAITSPVVLSPLDCTSIPAFSIVPTFFNVFILTHFWRADVVLLSLPEFYYYYSMSRGIDIPLDFSRPWPWAT